MRDGLGLLDIGVIIRAVDIVAGLHKCELAVNEVVAARHTLPQAWG